MLNYLLWWLFFLFFLTDNAIIPWHAILYLWIKVVNDLLFYYSTLYETKQRGERISSYLLLLQSHNKITVSELGARTFQAEVALQTMTFTSLRHIERRTFYQTDRSSQLKVIIWAQPNVCSYLPVQSLEASTKSHLAL